MDIPLQVLTCFRATAAALAAGNPTYPANILVIESDTGKAKFTDGVTAYNSLRYANFVTGAGGKTYRGLISQSGTSTPTLTDQLSTLSAATLTPARTGAGVYTFTLTNEFAGGASKVMVLATLQDNATAFQVKAGRTDANTITVKTFNGSGTAADLQGDCMLEIGILP